MPNSIELEKRFLKINSEISKSVEPEPVVEKLPEFCQILDEAYKAIKEVEGIEDYKKQVAVIKKHTNNILQFWTNLAIMHKGVSAGQNNELPQKPIEIETGIEVAVYSEDDQDTDEQILNVVMYTDKEQGHLQFVTPPSYSKNPGNKYDVIIEYQVGERRNEGEKWDWDRSYDVSITKGRITKLERTIINRDKKTLFIRSSEHDCISVFNL